jgi:hypothetical protein
VSIERKEGASFAFLNRPLLGLLVLALQAFFFPAAAIRQKYLCLSDRFTEKDSKWRLFVL